MAEDDPGATVIPELQQECSPLEKPTEDGVTEEKIDSSYEPLGGNSKVDNPSPEETVQEASATEDQIKETISASVDSTKEGEVIDVPTISTLEEKIIRQIEVR